jgi:hypothetical protein
MEFEPGQKFVLGERGKREGQKDEQPKKRFFHNILLFRIVLIETSGIVKQSFMVQSTRLSALAMPVTARKIHLATNP